MRGARGVTRAAGIDRAVEVAAEDAIVAAVESEAVERAMARVLEGPVVEEAVSGALESEAVKRALLEAMDSELVDEVWRRLLASEEAQQLVERIAEAPEVRAAISAQGIGLVEDVGRAIGRIARRLDDRFDAERLPLRQSTKRLFGLGLSVLAFGLGFLGIVFGERRRGWADRIAATEVVYDERRPEPAPWSRAASLSDSAAPAGPAG
ncbi:MAG: hypothetical protein ACJ76D_04990 [Solirubrobacterales bacterium]